MNLTFIKKAIETQNLETLIKSPEKKIPVERLYVSLPTETKEPLLLEIMYVPEVEKELEKSKLLQFFVYINESNNKEHDNLRKKILDFNIHIPIGLIGLHQRDNFIYFKHNQIIPTETNAGVLEAIKELIWLITHTLNTFLS